MPPTTGITMANLNLRSMALDSELHVLSQAADVAFTLRSKLFSQCSGDPGPSQFANMEEIFKKRDDNASSNSRFKTAGTKLSSQLLPFNVDRKPGSPVV